MFFLLPLLLALFSIFPPSNYCLDEFAASGNGSMGEGRLKRQFVPQPMIPPSLVPQGQSSQGVFCLQQISANLVPRCVYITSQPALTWYGAQQFCQQRFGPPGLFSLQYEAENQQIFSLLALFREGLSITASARSFWLGMICQCQPGQPFSCVQCQWSDGHQISVYSAPPITPEDRRIGPFWSRGFVNDHFWRASDGRMCLFATDHWALYDCGFSDPNGGFICEIPYNLAMQIGANLAGK